MRKICLKSAKTKNKVKTSIQEVLSTHKIMVKLTAVHLREDLQINLSFLSYLGFINLFICFMQQNRGSRDLQISPICCLLYCFVMHFSEQQIWKGRYNLSVILFHALSLFFSVNILFHLYSKQDTSRSIQDSKPKLSQPTP